MAWGGGKIKRNSPGSYIRYKVKPTPNGNATDRGILAVAMPLSWGKDNEAFKVTYDDYTKKTKKIFGYNYGSPELALIDEMYQNAKEVIFYRLNSNGTKATGTFGTAVNSGEFGNKITVVVEELESDEDD